MKPQDASDLILRRILKNFKWDVNKLVLEGALENKDLKPFHDLFLLMNINLWFYEKDCETFSYFREEIQTLQDRFALELEKPKKPNKIKLQRRTTALTKEKLAFYSNGESRTDNEGSAKRDLKLKFVEKEPPQVNRVIERFPAENFPDFSSNKPAFTVNTFQRPNEITRAAQPNATSNQKQNTWNQPYVETSANFQAPTPGPNYNYNTSLTNGPGLRTEENKNNQARNYGISGNGYQENYTGGGGGTGGYQMNNNNRPYGEALPTKQEKMENDDELGFKNAKQQLIQNMNQKKNYNNNEAYGKNSQNNFRRNYRGFKGQGYDEDEIDDLTSKVHKSVFHNNLKTNGYQNNYGRGYGRDMDDHADEPRRDAKPTINNNMYGGNSYNSGNGGNNNGNQESNDAKLKTMGARKKFVPPLKSNESNNNKNAKGTQDNGSKYKNDENLKHLDEKMIELIESEIIDRSPKITYSNIAGLQFAKKTIHEVIVWPLLRPDIFCGIRAPPKGLLLFGPPGTGKTMIGKAIASESNSTFFSISSSSLTSKWVGEGEKMVKTLFAIATSYQPSVIFIDEIDSLLCSRSENEIESSRRIKTEFLVQLDGAKTTADDRILIIGATNRPQELDEAVRRRFVKRLYIPLPNSEARGELIKTVMRSEGEKGIIFQLMQEEIDELVRITKGHSGADLRNLCQEASMIPIRNISNITEISKDSLRPTNFNDFLQALKFVKATVCPSDLKQYSEWNKSFGSFDFSQEDLDN